MSAAEATAVELIIHGTRGSVPVAGEPFVRHGGNTTCFELDLGEGERLLIDAGSGIQRVEQSWRSRGGGPSRWQVYFTHYHWDHLLGLPLFAPLHDPAASFAFHGFRFGATGVRAVLERAIAPPLFPIALGTAAASARFHDLSAEPRELGPVTLDVCPVNHPQGAQAYRLSRGSRRVVIATDHEWGDPAFDQPLVVFAREADVLIADAQWTPREAAARRGWGHSSWRDAVSFATAAGVARLVLFHHDPSRTDEAIDRFVEAAAESFAAVVAAREGMVIAL